MRRTLKDADVDVCGRVDFVRTEPLLERGERFCFSCAGCGDCCRGREDIVLSGVDLWRIAARLRLPPRVVSRGFCRESIGRVSRLPVLRLAPVRENGNSCPFLSQSRCTIHDAKPLVCALYPLAQEIDADGQVCYFLQQTGCGGQLVDATVGDYLAQYGIPQREELDVRWALTCMELENRVETLEQTLEPVLWRQMQAALWQELYYHYDLAQPFAPQFARNLEALGERLERLAQYQQKRTIKKSDR